ncbi:UNVERIFIED_CONTAM: hypothetical protein HDU68_004501, partial [Siphonaria sp. JEL0065]
MSDSRNARRRATGRPSSCVTPHSPEEILADEEEEVDELVEELLVFTAPLLTLNLMPLQP